MASGSGRVPDKIVIFRVLTPRVRFARRYFRRLKAQLMVELRQESILVVEKRVDVL